MWVHQLADVRSTYSTIMCNLPWYSHPAELLCRSRLVQSNKYPSSECKICQAGPLHNPLFLILLIMRWSLILSVFVAVQSALSFLCAALVIPPSLDGLEKRASHDPAKISSKAYREHSKSHPNAYHVQGLGPTGKLTAETKVTKTTLKKGERHHYGHELLTSADGKKLHAGTLLRDVRLLFLLVSCVVDHVFEVQMLHRHLEKSPGVPKFKSVFTPIMLRHRLIIFLIRDLNGNLQKKLRNILNGPKNMAIIPASINQSVRFLSWQMYCIRFTPFQKGQLIKHGMEGKKINRNKGRDEYALKSYGTAHKTAKKLDDALEEVSLCNPD